MKFERIHLASEHTSFCLDSYVADPIPCLTRKAILVIPGGGYGAVCSDREGEPIAMAFLAQGYNAFVLHYTVDKKHPFPTQLIEASLAVCHIRDHAQEYGIDPEQVFAVGFSAGGHLCASLGVLWKLPEVQKVLGRPYGYNRPNGVMLVYPVISGALHRISFQNLWATKEPNAEQLAVSSIENHIDKDSAPAFILHTANDQLVDVRNSLAAADAYAKAGVPFEVHIFPDSPHGVALGNNITACGNPDWIRPEIARWISMAEAWTKMI